MTNLSDGTPIFQLDQLRKEYTEGTGNRLEILNGVDYTFYEKRTVSIVGSSGSGKSTLLNLLGGLDQPTAGTVLFRGQNIQALGSNSISEWRNERVGFIFQAHHLLPDFTALENVIIPSLIAGKPKRECVEHAKALLDQVNLADRQTHKSGQLSGGEQQRIAIARALINNPDVILADEPTGNLDNKTGEMVSQLLLDICQRQGATLIMVTHNTRLADCMEVKLQLFDGQLSPE